MIVDRPPATIRIGKYQRALYSIPAVPPKKTRILVSLSVMAFVESWTAARAMMPTVALFRPDSRAYTGSGSVSLMCEMPTARP